MLTQDEGEFLVKIAREAITKYLVDEKVLSIPTDTPEVLKDFMGGFVTINSKGVLRGCIGYPEPVKPLIETIIIAAISAATQDPRFPPVTRAELDDLEVEVSILTKPELINVDKPSEYPDKIKVGEDGLIIELGYYRGLLLPQVPLEWNWNVNEFLENTCIKAGLTNDCWLKPDVEIYKFQSQIFKENE